MLRMIDSFPQLLWLQSLEASPTTAVVVTLGSGTYYCRKAEQGEESDWLTAEEFDIELKKEFPQKLE